jgi:hypothetical protein
MDKNRIPARAKASAVITLTAIEGTSMMPAVLAVR